MVNRPESGETKAGICHARGVNENLPSQWLIYINVADIEKSVASCVENGGKQITNVKNMGTDGKYCVIEEPAGAICALFEPVNK